MYCNLYDIYLKSPQREIDVHEGSNGILDWCHASM
jgi:hypothetical protein